MHPRGGTFTSHAYSLLHKPRGTYMKGHRPALVTPCPFNGQVARAQSPLECQDEDVAVQTPCSFPCWVGTGYGTA